MARLPYADLTDDSLRPLAEQVRAARGSLLTLYRMLLHSPPIAMGWLSLLSAVRKESNLSGDLRELLVMQIACLNGASYEWAQHHGLARREGLTERQLERIADWRSSPELFTDLQRAALEYSEAMTREVRVPRATFDRLSSFLQPRQLVELTVTVAAYNMVSRVLEALEIWPDDGLGSLDGG